MPSLSPGYLTGFSFVFRPSCLFFTPPLSAEGGCYGLLLLLLLLLLLMLLMLLVLLLLLLLLQIVGLRTERMSRRLFFLFGCHTLLLLLQLLLLLLLGLPKEMVVVLLLCSGCHWRGHSKSSSSSKCRRRGDVNLPQTSQLPSQTKGLLLLQQLLLQLLRERRRKVKCLHKR